MKLGGPRVFTPTPYERVTEALKDVDRRVQRKVTGGNAAKPYNIPCLPGSASEA